MSNGLDELIAEVGRIKGQLESIQQAAQDIPTRVREMGEYGTKIDATNTTVADLEARVKALEAVLNMGRGAVWIFLKVSAIVAALAGAVAWLWDRQ